MAGKEKLWPLWSCPYTFSWKFAFPFNLTRFQSRAAVPWLCVGRTLSSPCWNYHLSITLQVVKELARVWIFITGHKLRSLVSQNLFRLLFPTERCGSFVSFVFDLLWSLIWDVLCLLDNASSEMLVHNLQQLTPAPQRWTLSTLFVVAVRIKQTPGHSKWWAVNANLHGDVVCAECQAIFMACHGCPGNGTGWRGPNVVGPNWHIMHHLIYMLH